jgi:hypothetical protein
MGCRIRMKGERTVYWCR